MAAFSIRELLEDSTAPVGDAITLKRDITGMTKVAIARLGGASNLVAAKSAVFDIVLTSPVGTHLELRTDDATATYMKWSVYQQCARSYLVDIQLSDVPGSSNTIPYDGQHGDDAINLTLNVHLKTSSGTLTLNDELTLPLTNVEPRRRPSRVVYKPKDIPDADVSVILEFTQRHGSRSVYVSRIAISQFFDSDATDYGLTGDNDLRVPTEIYAVYQ